MDFSVEYDVAVVGGGVAGVAAAIQSARSGKKTVLVEKTVLLGGLATTGLVYIYLPLCDGNGHQVTFGLSEELFKASIEYGPGNIPAQWKNQKNGAEESRYRCVFSPASFMLALDEMIEQAGVDLWLDTMVCDAEVENQRIVSMIVENESGRGRIRAKRFVDASGSAILMRRAGVPCLDKENFMSLWGIAYDSRTEQKTPFGKYVKMDAVGAWADGGTSMPDDLLQRLGTSKEEIRSSGVRGISGKSESEFILRGRRYFREYFKLMYEKGTATRENFYALKLPAMPQFRNIYCVDGEYVLRDGEHTVHFEDSVGLAADWRKAGYVWEIPYRSLIPKSGMNGILAAGRCSAAQGDAWEITRVIPIAAMTGQVAGLAAARSIDAGVEPRDLNVKDLQSELRRLGFPLFRTDLGL